MTQGVFGNLIGNSMMGGYGSQGYGTGNATGINWGAAKGGVQNAFPQATMNPNLGQNSNDFGLGDMFDGIGGMDGIFSLANLLAGSWIGNKQLGYAEDMMKQNQDQFNKNYDAQRNLTNAAMRDRRTAQAGDPNYRGPTVEEYMSQYGIADRNKKTA